MDWLFSGDLRGLEPWTWAAALGVFVLGGVVKGALGAGLPLFVVPVLSLRLPPPVAIALMVVPVLASNGWQAYDTRASRSNMRRFWPLLGTLVVSTVLTVPMTLRLSNAALSSMLALAVMIAITCMALNPQIKIASEREPLAGAAVGLISGALGGVSSLTGPVMITYLMSLKLKREDFVGSISVIYLFASVPLYAAMAYTGRLDSSHLALSCIAMVPVAAGLRLGKMLRRRLNEAWFRWILLAFLGVVALALLFK
jgi:uncharacterized membrane protein YfcA